MQQRATKLITEILPKGPIDKNGALVNSNRPSALCILLTDAHP